LKSWAEIKNPYTNPDFERAIAPSFSFTLRDASVEYFMTRLMSGSLPESEALFDKATWAVDDLLALPPISRDTRPGVYGDIATRNIDYPNETGCDLYFGCAMNLDTRTKTHLAIKAAGLKNLKKEHKKSFHYSQICKPDVQANIRKFMAFPPGTPRGIPQLGEGIWLIFGHTFKYPGYYSAFAPEPSYRLVENIRETMSSRLPSLPWHGMNAAWSLSQGFRGPWSRPSPCANPACDRVTLLGKQGGSKRHREHSGDPFAARYLCNTCYFYRYRNGSLPTLDHILKVVTQQAAWICGQNEELKCWNSNCGKTLSELLGGTDKPRHRCLQSIQVEPGRWELLCNACEIFFRRHGIQRTGPSGARIPTADESEARVARQQEQHQSAPLAGFRCATTAELRRNLGESSLSTMKKRSFCVRHVTCPPCRRKHCKKDLSKHKKEQKKA
jgi:hypothetical protein